MSDVTKSKSRFIQESSALDEKLTCRVAAAISSPCVSSPRSTDSAMDLVLNVADRYVLTPYVYPEAWAEDGALRQILSLLVLTNLGAAVLYLGLGAFSYFFIFDHNLKKHPHFLEVRRLDRIHGLIYRSRYLDREVGR